MHQKSVISPEPSNVRVLFSKWKIFKYSEIDSQLDNILKNGNEAARALRLGSTKKATKASEYKFIGVIWCITFVVLKTYMTSKNYQDPTPTPPPHVYPAPVSI